MATSAGGPSLTARQRLRGRHKAPQPFSSRRLVATFEVIANLVRLDLVRGETETSFDTTVALMRRRIQTDADINEQQHS
jgi:hypothetical protein